jgi:Zn finger protein HypA/HybF involved in hydrogenase expression
MSVAQLNRTLDQELLALERGASLECLVCGEFVLKKAGMLRCSECASSLAAEAVSPPSQLQFSLQAG